MNSIQDMRKACYYGGDIKWRSKEFVLNDQKNVLITGISGFIGGAVAAQLVERGYSVHGYVRKNSRIEYLKENFPDIKFHYGDINDQRALALAMQDMHWVIHCAGVNSFWEKQRRRYHQVNTHGTRTVMLIAHEADVEKVINVSTVMAYGFPEDIPFNEETQPGKHMSEYAHSKYMGDREAFIRYRKQGLPLVTVYLAAVLGAGDPKDVMQVRRFIEGKVPLMIDSPYRFTYLYIKDAARAIVRAAEKENNIGERYLVGGQTLTTREYFDLISEFADVPVLDRTIGRFVAMQMSRLMTFWASIIKRPPLMPLDLIRTVYAGDLTFDSSKAEEELGLKYTPLRTAIKEVVDSFNLVD